MNAIKSVIRSIIVAFSLYSRIPMPVFTWQEKDMKHAISALPLIGAVIGGLSFAVFKVTGIFEFPHLSIILLLSVLPLIITGGFHMDGIMDVQDARNSYQDRQKKLKIMKDPHIGAFSVISVIIYGMIWFAFFNLLISNTLKKGSYNYLYIYMVSFFIVRAACGLTSILFEKARRDGMLNTETKSTGGADKIVLTAELLLGMGVMLFLDIIGGIISIAAIVLFTVYYKAMCSKNFGGVTGDTAGFYICVCEEAVMVCISLAAFFA
ncbi:adenosylcobinamide-GDP ribazoletransferase [Butyrivibrio sp. JL13D10]|uniref:adenosylcobinamide-GDP ribazoletransferase n=1 Tax=Butyrivibrio sp. JL13D10 TaxID=3236815 RepID=UPI0038B5E582